MAVTLARRRREASGLMLASVAFLAVRMDALTVTLAYALIAGVIFLMWKNFDEEKRASSTSQLEGLTQLLSLGMSLQARYKATEVIRSAWDKSRDRALVCYDMQKWINRVRAEIASYPEFMGIFEACSNDDPAVELRERVRRLTEIKRLISLSPKVGIRWDAMHHEHQATNEIDGIRRLR